MGRKYRTSTRYLQLYQNRQISEYPVGESTHLLLNREISKYPVGKSTHLLQNR
jgi:hypothetical protein